MPDHIEDVAPDIADNSTLAAGMFLGAYYALCVQASADGNDMPEPHDASAALEGQPIADLLDVTLTVMQSKNKKAMTRYLAGMADIIAEHGAELQTMLHGWMKPDRERQVILILNESDALKLAEAVGIEL